MAAETFSSEFGRYDKKQRACNMYTLVGMVIAYLARERLLRRQLLRWACGARHLRAG